jgi:hypothetical protein
MKKQELTTDHTVIYRNGGSFKPTSITGLINLNGYLNDDLTDVENELNDIIEVQKDGQTIWKRDFEKKDLQDGDECELRNGKTPIPEPIPTCANSAQVEAKEFRSFDDISRHQRFFDFMTQEHNLTLLDGEMHDIIHEASVFLKEKDTTPIELLRSLPESVQFVIVNAMSEEQKTSLIGL